MEMNENEWNVNNFIWEQHGRNGMEWNHFMTILLLNPYFKIKRWIYRGILGVLVKKSLGIVWEEGMKWNEKNHFRIFFSSLVWKF